VYHRRGGTQGQESALLSMETKSDRIQTALSYARQNLRSQLSVEEVAAAAHLSVRQFTRAFRQETGRSPAKAVEALRVEVARVMLEEGSHSVEEVADAAGFGEREDKASASSTSLRFTVLVFAGFTVLDAWQRSSTRCRRS
jgi:transcriptional regulator GlxA family with amidase domain